MNKKQYKKNVLSVFFSSFNSQARYQQTSLGPIQQSTILVVDLAKGNILKASGRNMYVIVCFNFLYYEGECKLFLVLLYFQLE